MKRKLFFKTFLLWIILLECEYLPDFLNKSYKQPFNFLFKDVLLSCAGLRERGVKQRVNYIDNVQGRVRTCVSLWQLSHGSLLAGASLKSPNADYKLSRSISPTQYSLSYRSSLLFNFKTFWSSSGTGTKT